MTSYSSTLAITFDDQPDVEPDSGPAPAGGARHQG
jgi:hypothetical protein